MKQVGFEFRSWGGKRRGAGRKPTGERAGVRHQTREVLKARFPVHVTWRMRKNVWNLRSRRCFGVLARAFWRGADRFGFKLVHYSVQGNHLHLLVEARDERALSRGMNGLGVRVARGLNRVMKAEMGASSPIGITRISCDRRRRRGARGRTCCRTRGITTGWWSRIRTRRPRRW